MFLCRTLRRIESSCENSRYTSSWLDFSPVFKTFIATSWPQYEPRYSTPKAPLAIFSMKLSCASAISHSLTSAGAGNDAAAGAARRRPPRRPRRAPILPVHLLQPRLQDALEVLLVVRLPPLHDEHVQRVPVLRAEDVRFGDVQTDIEERGRDAREHPRPVQAGDGDLVHRDAITAPASVVAPLVQVLEVEAAPERRRPELPRSNRAHVVGGVHVHHARVARVAQGGGAQSDPPRLAHHRHRVGLRGVQQLHMLPQVFEVVNVEAVPARQAHEMALQRHRERVIGDDLRPRLLQPLQNFQRHPFLRRPRLHVRRGRHSARRRDYPAKKSRPRHGPARRPPRLTRAASAPIRDARAPARVYTETPAPASRFASLRRPPRVRAFDARKRSQLGLHEDDTRAFLATLRAHVRKICQDIRTRVGIFGAFGRLLTQRIVRAVVTV